jgi:serine phosphatase RsbU (regulator of sigma subunit)
LNPPSSEVANSSWKVEGWSQPAEVVGGDFVEVRRDGDIVRIWIGDVTGHGRLAAYASTVLRAKLQQFFAVDPTPQALRAASASVYNTFEGERFLCTTFITLNERQGRATVWNAGNPSVVVRRKQSNTIESIPSTGMPLGLVAPGEWVAPEPTVVELAPGDQLICFTDGLVDDRGRRGRFGMRRVIRVLQQRPDEAISELASRFTAFSNPQTESDDVTVVSIQRDPA